MGHSYFGSSAARRAYEAERKAAADQADAEEQDARRRFAAKIVMAITDKLVAEIVRPGPNPEERECYEMAGEFRAAVPSLEELVLQIINAENGVE